MAVENTARQSSASSEDVDGDSVHGCSKIRLIGVRMMPPQISEPAAGTSGCSVPKLRPKIAAQA